MKMNRIIFPLMVALVAMLAATGCKKTPPKTTALPGNQPIVRSEQAPETMTPVQPYDPNAGVNRGANPPTGIPLVDDRGTFENMKMDREAFAAHTIHFSFDSAVIKKAEQSNIEAVAMALKSAPANKVLIEGNCDERGTKEYNMALGERRALAAREALVKAGISPDRIRTVSYGKDKPADTSGGDAAWAKNRRDDFILLLPKGTM
jgi:peptidoglycan-associated lipoprotein